jgi:ADP-ribose pyrophosphatase YjhB (NUDIX family)
MNRVEEVKSSRPLRLAARVIVLDAADRVLLFRNDSFYYGVHWGTPGGGLDPGEDYHGAAVRELREETGWDDVPVGVTPVFELTRENGPASRFSATVHRFFVARLPGERRPVTDVDGMHASDGIIGYHWWTLAELAATAEPVWPGNLAALVLPLIELPERHAGRVIVVDPEGRVLLFRYDEPPPFGVHWATPGGGLDPGEDYRAGAARELREETGWDDVPAGEALPALSGWRTILHAEQGRPFRQHERFFLARVTVPRRPVADVGGMHASDGIRAARWWSLAELEATRDVIYPAGLAGALRDLLHHG